MPTERFLHMRLSREDCANLDALVDRVSREQPEKGRLEYRVTPPTRTQSDVVRLAIAEALLRRCEERV
ncbi:MAG: hypothetical protein OXC25_09940 [Thiotrichales bacterium]|nr:hypothetical protein [Thiotrichales bacterium]MCY4284595.1 hypothetical protein [Thiotrichales bacterium]MCY4350152.1 hypothetical protein [Thiotrichales bacterium]